MNVSILILSTLLWWNCNLTDAFSDGVPLLSADIEQPQAVAVTPLHTDGESASAFPISYPIITGTQKLEWPELDSKVGVLTSEDLDLYLDLYWSNEQKYVDASNSAIMSYWGNLPGDLSGHVVIADHNYQSGRIFAGAENGDTICIETVNGIFYFEYAGCQYAQYKKMLFPEDEASLRGIFDGSIWYYDLQLDDGTYLFESAWNNEKDDDGMFYIYTCYPLDAAETDQRLVIQFRLIEGVQLVEKNNEGKSGWEGEENAGE